MKYFCFGAFAAFLAFSSTLRAADNIGTLWLVNRTDTTIHIGYTLGPPWKLVGHYKIKYSEKGSQNYQQNITSEETNKVENLKPNTRYLVFVEAQSQRRRGASVKMYRQVGFTELATKGNNFATCNDVRWHDNVAKSTTYDGANCFVADMSKLGITFVYNNKYYLRPRTDSACPASQCTCPMGTMQGDRCFIRQKPPFGFIGNNTFYMQATTKGECPLGGAFDGKACSFGTAPAGTLAVESNGNFYTTRLPYCADGKFDGANCWLGDAPAWRRAFLHNGAFYFE